MEQRLRAFKLQMEPPPGKGFFRLPWELRMRIYELSLIELPKWEKVHNPDCFMVAKDLHSCERPPFINKSIIYTQLPECKCAKRHSLNLLLANRQVHNEAAPVFWSRNVFCFGRAKDLVENISKSMRPSHRLLLRHIVFLGYGCDSLPNKAMFELTQPIVEELWDTLLQCNSLRTLEMSHNVYPLGYNYVNRIRKMMPDLESLRMTTLMAYRILPRRDQSEPQGRPPWTLNDGEATNRPPRQNTSNNTNNSESQQEEHSFMPFANAIPAPPPPPPAEHYFVFNPYLAGYDYCAHRDLSRTLWFKANYVLDVDAASESSEAYNEILRNFRTNFLVHLRHEITKLPEAWARDYQMGAASLRTPWTRPPEPLPPRDFDQAYTSDSSSDSNGASWNPDHGVSRHHPQAIRRVCGRLPEHMRDGPYTDNNVVLRDGRHVPLQIMGLPVSKQMRTWRYKQRMRLAREKHAAGELTAREEIEAKEAQDRRDRERLHRQLYGGRNVASMLQARQARNTARNEEQRTEAREARAAERAQLDEQREAQEAVRQAARRRHSSKGAAEELVTKTNNDDNVDEGSEADTEEDDKKRRKVHKTTKPKVRGRVYPTPPKKPRNPARADWRDCVSSKRQQGRMELYYGMRDGIYDDEFDYDVDSSDYDNGELVEYKPPPGYI
ncbi:hypothetical protein SBRCBS47491_000734 [Sporothrix bragantina]|uniref:Uncharacterized protein n=1 Tax=Sporothrix bragantina TaxID=671064 RepID=A0ABP0AST5_9PEZI